MRLQILIPQYNETEDILAPLLKSIALQQNVNMDDIGVIIANDGTDTILSEKFLNSFPFDVQYLKRDHRGVSATRNSCLDAATADYVMFCDADDMFFNMCGLYIVFREIAMGGFDVLVSQFVEETRNPMTKETVFINHDMDGTFVHGKFFRRQYLLDNKIRWNDALTIHEDSYFNILAQRLTSTVKYCSQAFYMWKWRDASVCRHDPKYILKTYNNMLDSNTALVKQFILRGRTDLAQFYSTMMIYDAYYTMNKAEWLNQENQEYRLATEKRFKEYYEEYKYHFETCRQEVKSQIIMGMKNRFFGEGVFLEAITFEDWIKHIEKL